MSEADYEADLKVALSVNCIALSAGFNLMQPPSKSTVKADSNV